MRPPSPDRAREPVRRIVVPATGSAPPRNAWLLSDGPLTLIDPGPATAAAYGAVRDALARFGCSIRDIERLVLTHAHGGHAGLAARIHADSGARVLAHPDAIEALRDPSAAAQRRGANWSRAVKAAGVPEDRAERILDGVRAALLADQADVPSSGSPAAAPLADGERLAGARDGEAAWTIRHVGGHSPDHIALTHSALGMAITGDLIDRQRPMPPALAPSAAGGARPAQLGALMRAWRRLAVVAPGAWLPGHGERIRAPRVLVARRLAEARADLHATRRALGEAPETAWRIAVRLGLTERSGSAEDAAAVETIVARLDWLVERGGASRTIEDGGWRFARAERAGRPAPPPGRV